MEDFFYRRKASYGRLPLALRSGIATAVQCLPPHLWHGLFYGAYTRRIDRFFAGQDAARVASLQWELVCDTVNWAVRHVPFYAGRRPLGDERDLREFPIVTKADYQEHMSAFLAPAARRHALPANTGGSSGVRMDFFLHKGRSRPKEKAHSDWYTSLFGWTRRSRVLVVRGKALQRNRLFERQTLNSRLAVSCHDITEANIGRVVDAIQAFRPEFILAYPSALMVFTKLLGDVSALGSERPLKAVFLGSEVLSDPDRRWFAQFYRTRIVSWYGHSECVLHGGCVPESDDYHFFPFYGYAELVDEDGKEIVEPDRVGRIVGTSFDNRVMPFIRYDTGDLGVRSSRQSPHDAYGSLVVRRIEGRGRDIVYLRDGSRISMTSFFFAQRFPQLTKVRELQLEQQVAGRLLMRIVKRPEYREEDEREIVNRLVHSVSGRLDVSVVYVDQIPKTLRGKHVFLVQRLHDQDLPRVDDIAFRSDADGTAHTEAQIR
ncbi:AMP-binding protein [Anaerobaca lacustris]|uniref:AMP-dependent synthetase/ligase domain-containing protein n=1 Tax=Anaerobaca lacustris TaxID=3044600 RepID=A0AAW6TUU8_9BACT|nr:hypothetical protein [Sedimentisphaerales bacterium M17dextr]